MADRRRINGPSSGTRPTVFASSIKASGAAAERPRRQRKSNELRKLCKNRDFWQEENHLLTQSPIQF